MADGTSTFTSGRNAEPGRVAGPHSLRAGALGLRELVANNIAEIAPAIASIFVLAAIFHSSGVASPLVILIACAGFYCHINVTAEFSRVAPSAGFYATYVARAFGPKTGAVIAGGYLLAMFSFYSAIFFQVGVWTSTIAQDAFGVTIPWWVAALVLEAIVVVLLLRGIKLSVGVAVALFIIEAVMLFAGAIAMLVTSGSYINWDAFNPANISGGVSGFGLGFVLAIFLFLGASGSSPLAEEIKNPRRALPIAIYAATFIAFFIYIFVAWSISVGFHNDATALNNAEFPFVAGVTKAAEPLKYLVYFAGFTSAIGVLIGAGNAGSRVLYNSARDGLVPAAAAKVLPNRRTPWVAIVVPTVAMMIVTLILGPLVGAGNAFNYMATLATDIFMVVFIVTNIAIIPYFWRKHRDRWSWIRHLIIPLLGVIAFAYPLYAAIDPGQEAPYNWFWILLLGAYVVAFLYSVTRWKKIGRFGERLADDEPSGSEANAVDVDAVGR